MLAIPLSVTQTLIRQVLPVLVTTMLYSIVSPAFKAPSSPGSVSAEMTEKFGKHKDRHFPPGLFRLVFLWRYMGSGDQRDDRPGSNCDKNVTLS